MFYRFWCCQLQGHLAIILFKLVQVVIWFVESALWCFSTHMHRIEFLVKLWWYCTTGFYLKSLCLSISLDIKKDGPPCPPFAPMLAPTLCWMMFPAPCWTMFPAPCWMTFPVPCWAFPAPCPGAFAPPAGKFPPPWFGIAKVVAKFLTDVLLLSPLVWGLELVLIVMWSTIPMLASTVVGLVCAFPWWSQWHHSAGLTNLEGFVDLTSS